MRSRSKLLVAAMVLLSGFACAAALLAQMPTYKLGKTLSAEELRPWDTGIGPEGKELPPGSGNAQQGMTVWAQRCAKCHGKDGKYQWPLRAHPPSGGKAPLLVGEKGVIAERQFATTLWDYVKRAMPLGEESGTLTDDEVYALTAYMLQLNGFIKENEVMDAKSLPKVRMPHRSGVPPK